MIVTVTLNPALYVDYTAERIELGGANSVSRVRHRVGGRGLAAARLLQTFGHDVTAAGLTGGSAGELIRAELSKAGVATRFTRIAAESRRVVSVADTAADSATSFREPPPYITTEELGRLAADYRALLDGATAVVLCGSLPAGLPTETYGSLTSYAVEAGVPVVLDASGDALRYGTGRGPALVIPEDPDDAADLDKADASSVVLHTHAGLRALTPGGEWLAAASPATIGQRCGEPPDADLDGFRDGLVAGLVPGIALGWSWPDMLRHALALAASATADGAVDLSAYEALLPGVAVSAAA